MNISKGVQNFALLLYYHFVFTLYFKEYINLVEPNISSRIIKIIFRMHISATYISLNMYLSPNYSFLLETVKRNNTLVNIIILHGSVIRDLK